MCLVGITNAILGDENTIITVSCYNEENNIFIGMPAVINKDGVKFVMDLELNSYEKELFDNSVNTIKNAILKIEE